MRTMTGLLKSFDSIALLILLSGCAPLPPVELQSVDQHGTAPLSHPQVQTPANPADSSTLVIDADAAEWPVVPKIPENRASDAGEHSNRADSSGVAGGAQVTPNCRPNCGQSTGLQVRPTVPLRIMRQALPEALRR